MEKFFVEGGRRLRGEIRPHGAKNSVLPILAACLLTSDRVELENCPLLEDIENMRRILEALGCRALDRAVWT